MAIGRVVALGGHEFRGRDDELAVVRHLLELTGADSPRICLLPTAGGDRLAGIASFHSTLSRFGARPSHVSLFRLERERVDLREHLLAQDLIYVAGGSMLNLVAIWRAHGLDELMREAYGDGILLAGQSAGAMCWFEQGITASAGDPRVAAGFGLLSGSLCVHYGRDPGRRSAYLAAVAAGTPDGYGLDDGAGLLFEDGQAVEAFAGRRGARVVRVEHDDGAAREMALRPIPLRPPLPALDHAVAEMREVHRIRRASTIGAWRSR